MNDLAKQLNAAVESDAMQAWLARTAGARKAACAGEVRAVKREALAASRREAFWAKHPHLRPQQRN